MRLKEAREFYDRGDALIREAMALVKVAAGECDGVSGSGAICVLDSTHVGHHSAADGTQWLDR